MWKLILKCGNAELSSDPEYFSTNDAQEILIFSLFPLLKIVQCYRQLFESTISGVSIQKFCLIFVHNQLLGGVGTYATQSTHLCFDLSSHRTAA